MGSRTLKEQSERVAWWKRRPWPAVVLGADPAEKAGGAILVPRENGPHVVEAREILTTSRGLEAFIMHAVEVARAEGLPLVAALETWNSGGRLGIKTWLGLGAAAGAWKRVLELAAREDCGDVLTVSRSIVEVPQVRWRSWMVEESGVQEAGKYRPFNSEEWKAAALRACAEHFTDVPLEGVNAAEALLVGAYVARSDELGRLLPATLLARHGYGLPPPVPEGKKRKGKKKAA